MKRLSRALLAAVALAGACPSWSAGAAAPQAETARQRAHADFLLHMSEAQRLIGEQAWPAATASAQSALEAARGGANSYEEFDAVGMLVQLLHKQQRHADARRAAESQMAVFDQRQASADAISQLLSLAISEGAAAGEFAEVSRLQQRLLADARPYPGMWAWTAGEPRLNYALADLSLPLAADGWALTHFKPANARRDIAQLRYVHALAGGAVLTARVWITYRENQRALDAPARRQAAKDGLADAESDQKPAPQAQAQLPDLPFADAVAAKRAMAADRRAGVGIDAGWTALRGDWRLDVHAAFAQAHQEEAVAQLRQLFAALRWQGDARLFRTQAMARQDQDIDTHWSMADDWPRAAELARAALPDAAFPLEIARLNSVIGVAAYQDDDLDAARGSLDLAMAAWAYAPKGYHDEILYQNAVDHAADVAYRQGRTQEAVALNRQFIAWTGNHASDWSVPEGRAELRSEASGMALPLRIGDFRLEPIDEKRFYYRNLKTGEQLGLSVDQNADLPDEALERSMRAFARDKLGLRILGLTTSGFTPVTQDAAGGPATGRKWEFEVERQPDDGRTIPLGPNEASAEAPDRVVFWVVDRGHRRAILRAEMAADSADPDGPGGLAQALAW